MCYTETIFLHKEGNTMATKKTASSKKSTAKKTSSSKVTTVKAASASKSAGKLFGLKLNRAPLLGAGLGEFVGAFLLAAAVIASSNQPVILLFALVGILLAAGALSGGHFNPALSIAAWATRRISGLRALVYIVAQVLGAVLALVVLNAFVSAAPAPSEQAAAFGQGAPQLFHAQEIVKDKEWVVFFAELLGATILGFAVASAWRAKDRLTNAFGYSVGLFVALLVAGSSAAAVSATAVLNPAVAVAVKAVDFSSITLWPIAVYVFSASLGAVIGFVLNDVLNEQADGGKD